MKIAQTRVQLNISSEGKDDFDRARELMMADPTLGLPSADKAIRLLSKSYISARLGKD